jgi:hypothetical protein
MLVCLLYTYTDEPKQFIKEYLKAIRWALVKSKENG